MAKLRSKCTDGERANYIESGMAMDRFLSNAIAMLQTRRSLTTDPAEALDIGVQIPKLQAEQAKISAEMAAYSAERSAINPPSDDDFATIQAQSAELDGTTASSDDANAILAVVTVGLETWNSTRA